MRAAAGYFVGWCLAALVAVLAAGQGVSLVADRVTSDRPAALSSLAVRQALGSSSPATGSAGAPAVQGSSSGGASGSSTETRTYILKGGTASLRFSPTGVEVVIADPLAGYSLSVEPEHGNGLKVEFRKEDRRSRVEAWWENGPQERVHEE